MGLYYEVKISAENQEKADQILNSLLEKGERRVIFARSGPVFMERSDSRHGLCHHNFLYHRQA